MLLVAAAAAHPCEHWADGMAVGPGGAGLLDGDLGVARRACQRTEAALSGGAYLLADTANFYGHIVAGGHFSGSYVFAPETEAFVDLELVRYDSVIAPIAVDYLGIGYTAVGLNRTVWRGERGVVALNGKVVAPTAVGLHQNAWPFGADLGLSAMWSPGEHVEGHAQIGVLGSAALGGPAFPAAGLRVTAGGVWRPGKAFGFGLDGVAGFGYVAPLDVVAVAPAFRFGIGRGGGLALEATVPLLGAERGLATVDLEGSWRFR